jgi:predicted amidohydrolase YtcJ
LFADRIFTNCRAYTLDASSTVVEAIAVRGGRIIALGCFDKLSMPRAEPAMPTSFPAMLSLSKQAGPETEVVDLGGRTVVPGLIDSHAHLIEYGISSTRSADLSGCASIREVQDRLRAFRKANPHPEWLLGTRFDQELFAERRWITRRDLDEASAEIPIMISRLCLHAVVLNSAALKLIRGKISSEQADSGILTEDATGLAWEQIPQPTPEEHLKAAQWALAEAKRAGLCGVHCMIDSLDDLDILRGLDERGLLPVRIRALSHVSMMDDLVQRGCPFGSGSEFLRIGGVKVFMDGSMGARTAAMREPFSDDPGNRGELFRNERDLAEILRHAQEQGFQAAIHAIGDVAVECALKGIELAAGTTPGNPWRHRVEHATQMSEDLIGKMARLGVIACVQPQFIITDFWTPERVGPERYKWSFPFKSMLSAGIVLAMGSDCPVERLDPFELVHRAVNREPLSLAERMSVEEVLRGYSRGSAFAGFDEAHVGSLEVGKFADFTVSDGDPFAVKPEEIGSLRVSGTVVGGLM